MKLCLDEHLSAAIAVALRARGHDVIAIQEIPELRSKPDSVIFREMVNRHRAIATEDVDDFLALASRAIKGPNPVHYGVVAVLPKRFPRRKSTQHVLITALDQLLAVHPKEGALVNSVFWLQGAQ